jgi:hypothetical protein
MGLVRAYLNGDDSWSMGHINDYDPEKYQATATLYPSMRETGWLEIVIPALGLALDHVPGSRCLVALDHGSPMAIVGVGHSDVFPAQDGVSIQSKVFVAGVLRSDMVELAPYFALPPATAETRLRLATVSIQADGEAGTADHLYVCLQNALGVPQWVMIV